MELHAHQKVPTDRQTAFRLYIIVDFGSIANYRYKFVKSRDKLVNLLCPLLYGILGVFPYFCQSLFPF